jgi:hypothetical protein
LEALEALARFLAERGLPDSEHYRDTGDDAILIDHMDVVNQVMIPVNFCLGERGAVQWGG